MGCSEQHVRSNGREVSVPNRRQASNSVGQTTGTYGYGTAILAARDPNGVVLGTLSGDMGDGIAFGLTAANEDVHTIRGWHTVQVHVSPHGRQACAQKNRAWRTASARLIGNQKTRFMLLRRCSWRHGT